MSIKHVLKSAGMESAADRISKLSDYAQVEGITVDEMNEIREDAKYILKEINMNRCNVKMGRV